MNSAADCDVLIAGAGPAGSVAAALLARSGRRVLLVDRVDDGRPRVGECLPAAAVHLLRGLELPAPDDGGPHARIGGVRSHWGDASGLHDGFNDPGGGAWRLDRARFDRDLRLAATASGARLLSAHVRQIDGQGDGWQITTADGARFEAATVIDATGRRARIARRVGACQHADEPLVAVWAMGERSPCDHSDRTLIETDESGWWYGAYLPCGRPMAIYHCAPSLATRLSREPRAWLDRLAATRLLAPSLPSTLFGHPQPRCADARGLVIDRVCGDNWFACGDAAISFNPLSSQGLFNAVATAAMVAKVLDAADATAARARYQSHIEEVRARYRDYLRELERQRDRLSGETQSVASGPNRRAGIRHPADA